MCATSPTPFKFDSVFDASDGGDLGHAADFRLRYSNADLTSAAEQSFEKGCDNGRFEAQQQIEGKLADALTSIARGLGQIEGRQIAAQERIRGDAVNLAHEIAATLAPALMRREPLAEITELISDCLSRMPMEPRIVVRLDETLVDLLRERIDGIATQSGFSGTVVLLGLSFLYNFKSLPLRLFAQTSLPCYPSNTSNGINNGHFQIQFPYQQSVAPCHILLLYVAGTSHIF